MLGVAPEGYLLFSRIDVSINIYIAYIVMDEARFTSLGNSVNWQCTSPRSSLKSTTTLILHDVDQGFPPSSVRVVLSVCEGFTFGFGGFIFSFAFPWRELSRRIIVARTKSECEKRAYIIKTAHFGRMEDESTRPRHCHHRMGSSREHLEQSKRWVNSEAITAANLITLEPCFCYCRA